YTAADTIISNGDEGKKFVAAATPAQKAAERKRALFVIDFGHSLRREIFGHVDLEALNALGNKFNDRGIVSKLMDGGWIRADGEGALVNPSFKRADSKLREAFPHLNERDILEIAG